MKETKVVINQNVSNLWNNNYTEYESNGDKNKNLSLEEYLNKVKPYLRDIIIDLQKFDTRKIQWTIATKLISLKDAEQERVMHSESKNINFTPYNDTNELTDDSMSHFVQEIKVT